MKYKIEKIFLLVLLPYMMFARPSGEQVVYGEVKISKNEKTVDLFQENDKAIINWENFSIKKDEKVKFYQPSESSLILNRITGSQKSYIDGKLYSNGKIILINPNGLMIGDDGVIKTAGLILSTLNLDDNNFIYEHFDFENLNCKFIYKNNEKYSDHSIDNYGEVSSAFGDIYMLSKKVNNYGNIFAKKNVFLIGAGEEICFQFDGKDNSIKIKGDGSLLQKNSIKAANVILQASGGNPYPLAINHTGEIEALSIKKKGGKVYLIADNKDINISGSIIAKNLCQGGEISIVGENINVIENAFIDVSHENNAGSIYIGNKDLTKSVNIAKNSRIYASSLENGNGGKVVFWSFDKTICNGQIAAKSLSSFGIGGDIEISSLGVISFNNNLDVTASSGLSGNIFLDPSDIYIVSHAPSNPLLTPNYNPPNSLCEVYIKDLYDLLKVSNVTISTSSETSGNGDIILDNVDFISPSSIYFLKLQSHRDIIIKGSTLKWNSLNGFTLNANRSIKLKDTKFLSNVGEIEMYANMQDNLHKGKFNGIELSNFDNSELSEIKMFGRGGLDGGHGIYFSGSGDIRLNKPGIITISGESLAGDGVRFENSTDKALFWSIFSGKSELNIIGKTQKNGLGINILCQNNNVIDFNKSIPSKVYLKTDTINIDGDFLGKIDLSLEATSDNLMFVGNDIMLNGIYGKDSLDNFKSFSADYSKVVIGSDISGGELNLSTYDYKGFDAPIIFKADDIIALEEISFDNEVIFDIGITQNGYISINPNKIFYEKLNIYGNDHLDHVAFIERSEKKIFVDGGSGKIIIERPELFTHWYITGKNTGNIENIEIKNLSKIIAHEGDILFGPSGKNTWQLSGDKNGSIADVNFAGIKRIIAKGESDIFEVRREADFFDISSEEGTVIVKGFNNHKTCFNVFDNHVVKIKENKFSSVVEIIGASLEDEIIGQNKDTVWKISGEKKGVVEDIPFSNIDNITCGTGNDEVIITDEAKGINIDGNEGDNIIIKDDTDTSWIFTDENNLLDDLKLEDVEEITDGMFKDVYDLNENEEETNNLFDSKEEKYDIDNEKIYINPNIEDSNCISVNNFKTFFGDAIVFYLDGVITNYNTYISTQQSLSFKPFNFSYERYLPYYDFMHNNLFRKIEIYIKEEKKK